MNRRQRKRQHARRRAHGPTPDQPRLIISRDSYSTVKQGHVVPVAYQRSFAVDEKVAVHVPGRADCVPLRIQNAGTRSRFYRRQRPDGTEIDDVEAMLAEVERIAAPVLRQVATNETFTAHHRDVLTQLLGIQMLRGPAFFSERHRSVEDFVPKTLTTEHAKPALLEQTGGDLELARDKVVELFRQPTQRLMSMTTLALKVAAVLGSMRWQLLRFDELLLAYSDQPVVVWPLDVDAFQTLPTEPRFGPLESLEVHAPLSPRLLLLMTWADTPDVPGPVQAPASYAAEANALTIAQADKQWMHRLGSEPPVATGVIRPLARAFETRYNAEAARVSRRRAATAKYLQRVRNKRFINDIEVVTIR
jgi:hypothetical protein